MTDPITAELLELNQRLLDSIAQADWNTYQNLCDPTLTAFEPEALGQLVEGMDFHRFYFERGPAGKLQQTTMCSPRVRLLGDVAVVAYVRLIQRVTAEGSTVTIGSEETRVWQRQRGHWKHVHFHRTAVT
jgi:calcium/calmodulin dependent protein kinase II association protein